MKLTAFSLIIVALLLDLYLVSALPKDAKKTASKSTSGKEAPKEQPKLPAAKKPFGKLFLHFLMCFLNYLCILKIF